MGEEREKSYNGERAKAKAKAKARSGVRPKKSERAIAKVRKM